MKKLKLILALAVSLWMPLAVAPLIVGCGGCVQLEPGADPVVVRAEQVAAGAFEVMDAFVELEANNRAAFRQLSPGIEQAANEVRTEGKLALQELRKATIVYKSNRSSTNKANVETYIALTEHFRAVATKYLNSLKTSTP